MVVLITSFEFLSKVVPFPMFSHIYIYIYDPQKCLNGTVEVALPFQTLVVDFSSNL